MLYFLNDVDWNVCSLIQVDASLDDLKRKVGKVLEKRDCISWPLFDGRNSLFINLC